MSSAVDFWKNHEHPDWHQDAACKEHTWLEFFGHEELPGKQRHRPALNVAEIARAQQICFSCPVMQECLEWALLNREEFGIWGGTTGRDRAKWWRAHGWFDTKTYCDGCGEEATACVC